MRLQLTYEEYGNKQLVISSLMETLLKIPPVTDANDKRMRALYDQIKVNVRSLQALGISAEMYGSLLIPVLMEKIAIEFQLIISRQMKSDTWDISKLMDVFKEELEAREKTSGVGGSLGKSGSKVVNLVTPLLWHLLYMHTVLFRLPVINVTNQATRRTTVLTDPGKCKAILKKKGRCFLCLKSGHIVKNCPAS